MKNYILIGLSIVGFSWFIIINIIRHYDKKEVLGSHLQTAGQIVSYHEVGTHLNRTLKYSYQVNGWTFTRIIYPDVDFSYCKTNIELCQEKRFVVIYSTKDNSKSLIDLRKEIQKGQKIEVPKSLDNFE